jgi:hypothetical protein
MNNNVIVWEGEIEGYKVRIILFGTGFDGFYSEYLSHVENIWRVCDNELALKVYKRAFFDCVILSRPQESK